MARFIEKNITLMVSVIITLITVAFAYGKIVEKVEAVDIEKIAEMMMCIREDISSLKTDMDSVKKEQDIVKYDIKELLKR